MSTRQWSVLSNRSILELPGKPFVWRPISVCVLPVRPGLHLVEHLEILGPSGNEKEGEEEMDVDQSTEQRRLQGNDDKWSARPPKVRGRKTKSGDNAHEKSNTALLHLKGPILRNHKGVGFIPIQWLPSTGFANCTDAGCASTRRCCPL